jgi:hypothetical protein
VPASAWEQMPVGAARPHLDLDGDHGSPMVRPQ